MMCPHLTVTEVSPASIFTALPALPPAAAEAAMAGSAAPVTVPAALALGHTPTLAVMAAAPVAGSLSAATLSMMPSPSPDGSDWRNFPEVACKTR